MSGQLNISRTQPIMNNLNLTTIDTTPTITGFMFFLPMCMSYDGSYIYFIDTDILYRSINKATPIAIKTFSPSLGNNLRAYPKRIQCTNTGQYVEIISDTGISHVSTDFGASFTSSTTTLQALNDVVTHLQISRNNIDGTGKPIYRCFVTSNIPPGGDLSTYYKVKTTFYLSNNSSTYTYSTAIPKITINTPTKLARSWGLAMSESGQYITYIYSDTVPGTALNSTSIVDVSSDYGVTFTTVWNVLTANGENLLSDIDTSVDGKYQIMSSGYIYFPGGIQVTGKVYLSTNYGATISLTTCPNLSIPQWAITNSTGQYQFIVESYQSGGVNYYIYGSSNYGTTWSQINVAPYQLNFDGVNNLVISKTSNIFAIYYSVSKYLYYNIFTYAGSFQNINDIFAQGGINAPNYSIPYTFTSISDTGATTGLYNDTINGNSLYNLSTGFQTSGIDLSSIYLSKNVSYTNMASSSIGNIVSLTLAYRYLYFFLQSPGGNGGNYSSFTSGGNGGSGAFVFGKIDLNFNPVIRYDVFVPLQSNLIDPSSITFYGGTGISVTISCTRGANGKGGGQLAPRGGVGGTYTTPITTGVTYILNLNGLTGVNGGNGSTITNNPYIQTNTSYYNKFQPITSSDNTKGSGGYGGNISIQTGGPGGNGFCYLWFRS